MEEALNLSSDRLLDGDDDDDGVKYMKYIQELQHRAGSICLFDLEWGPGMGFAKYRNKLLAIKFRELVLRGE